MERDKRIDVLRAWGIFLVIAGHSGSPFSGFIYTFHMPLFFFITGYLRYNGKVYSWRSFIAKKIKSVLVPVSYTHLPCITATSIWRRGLSIT